jgi:hypothetical protein
MLIVAVLGAPQLTCFVFAHVLAVALVAALRLKWLEAMLAASASRHSLH